MPTSLSLLHTLAPSASFTLHPTTVSAGSLPRLLAPVSYFILFFWCPFIISLTFLLSTQVCFSSYPTLSASDSLLIRSQIRRLCFVSPRTLVSSLQLWSWTGSESTGTTSQSLPPREVRASSLYTNYTGASLAPSHWIISSNSTAFSETSIFSPLTPAPTDD